MLQAVDDVSVEIAQGEFFGIVGRNGSGKSTLLKCLAGIYNIDEGELHVRGRLSPFIELGVGFNPDLTARDNVTINGIMLGLTRKQVRERFDTIIGFAELEDFLDLRLKNYSSGMVVRLAFSIAIQVDAEILLIDEVLAVGDATFQQKCFDEFHRLKAEGRTILFVTHSMLDVQRFCDRAMLLEKGRVVELGDPATVTRRYNELNFGARCIHDTGAGKPDRRRAPRRRDRRRLVREPGRRADPGGRPRRAVLRVPGGPLQRARWTTRSSASRCATRSATRCSQPRRPSTTAPPGTSRPGEHHDRATAL